MPEPETPFILSTHEDGKLKKKVLLNRIISYFLVSVVLIILGLYVYYALYIQYDFPIGIFWFMPYLLILLGFCTFFLGIYRIRYEETIMVDAQGIAITRGKNTKSTAWSEILEVKSWRTLYPTAGYRSVHMRSIEQIVIKTSQWTSRIKVDYFTENEVRELFRIIARHAQGSRFNVLDELGWLPESPEFQQGRQSGQSYRIREYRILVKIGVVLLLLSALFLPVFFLLDLFSSKWIVLVIVFFVFGVMCALAGVLGLGEEKKKSQHN
ncbi:MAG: tetraspanin family protein [Candidatus Thermoplasmatota archaeon]|nr:tetraspanin family protein [Candidatus Thermoplasmatota archaeon]